VSFDWKGLLSAGIGDVVEKTGEAIDRLVTSDQERLELKNALQEIKLNALDRHEEREKELDLAADEQATTRLQYDMSSDNAWSKNIRPMSFAAVLAAFFVLALTDGNIAWTTHDMVNGIDTLVHHSFSIRDNYITIFMYLLLTMVGFYFSSRGIEKIADIISKVWKR